MKLCAIDTSTLIAGVAVGTADQLTVRRGRVTSHSDELLAMIDASLREAGLRPAELDGIVCGAGPGSFTGLRIGLATAKGLAFSLGKPLVTVSSLATLAARARSGTVYALLNAYKQEVYVGAYQIDAGEPVALHPERVRPPSEIVKEIDRLEVSDVQLVGDGIDAYPELFARWLRLDADGAPHPRELVRLGAARLARGEVSDLAFVAPHYIRPSEAELMKK